jgi:hypothetical protein
MKLRDSEIVRMFCAFRRNGEPAARALESARTVVRFRANECGEHDSPDFETARVRLRMEPEQENYFDVYGRPKSEAEAKRISDLIERLGCYFLVSEYWDGEDWQHADSIGMIIEERPLDPVSSPYVVDLMGAALAELDKLDAPDARIERAIHKIREARAELRAAGATRAADYVARALKSVQGAARHAEGKRLRSSLAPVVPK